MAPLALLKQLIAIPSVNPMGRGVDGPDFLEERMSDFLVEFFRQLGLAQERIEVTPGRSNVIAFLEGSANQPTVLLDAHQDTVPVDGMTIDPFIPVIRDGRVHGRGACDVKGGMAAMLSAVERLVRERPRIHASATCLLKYANILAPCASRTDRARRRRCCRTLTAASAVPHAP